MLFVMHQREFRGYNCHIFNYKVDNNGVVKLRVPEKTADRSRWQRVSVHLG